MKNRILFILTFFIFSFSFAQKSASYFRTIDYFDKQDSSKNYAVVYRPNAAPKKLLILFPGYGESPLLAERETKIPELAATNGILSLILSTQNGSQSFFIDNETQTYLDSLM